MKMKTELKPATVDLRGLVEVWVETGGDQEGTKQVVQFEPTKPGYSGKIGMRSVTDFDKREEMMFDLAESVEKGIMMAVEKMKVNIYHDLKTSGLPANIPSEDGVQEDISYEDKFEEVDNHIGKL